MFPITAWIGAEPGTVFTTGGRFRSGMFSLNWKRPGRFASGGVRPTRLSQTSGLNTGERRTISMIEPPGTFGTPARTFGSIARNFVP